MAIYHPTINIETNKSYCVMEYRDKEIRVQRQKLKELSEDKTGWSDKVIKTVRIIIDDLHLDLPYDIIEPHFNTMKTVNYSLEKELTKYEKKALDKKVYNILDNAESADDATVQTTEEIYLASNPKYNGYNDIRMAHLILLLSNLAKMSKILWVTVTLRVQELKNNILYFMSENGRIVLSEKTGGNKDSGIQDYIDSLNEIIDGKREVPR